MKRVASNLFIFCLYCFPFAYVAMYVDFAKHSMLGYLLMIATTSFLVFYGQRYSKPIVLVFGNIASALFSFYLTSTMQGIDAWSGYFKPFTPYQLCGGVVSLNIVQQLIVMRFACKRCNMRST